MGSLKDIPSGTKRTVQINWDHSISLTKINDTNFRNEVIRLKNEKGVDSVVIRFSNGQIRTY